MCIINGQTRSTAEKGLREDGEGHQQKGDWREERGRATCKRRSSAQSKRAAENPLGHLSYRAAGQNQASDWMRRGAARSRQPSDFLLGSKAVPISKISPAGRVTYGSEAHDTDQGYRAQVTGIIKVIQGESTE